MLIVIKKGNNMEKIVKKGKISAFNDADLEFWISRPVEERIFAV